MKEAFIQGPAVIDVDGKKVAIFAVTTTFEVASKAGYETKTLKGRPGVNYLGMSRYYQITPEMEKQLIEIAKVSHVNGYRNLSIKGGFVLPDKEGLYNFGGLSFCSDGSKKGTECNATDLARIVENIKKVKEKYDYVIILTHCHDIKTDKHEDVPEFLEELAHACIDAGVCAVIGPEPSMVWQTGTQPQYMASANAMPNASAFVFEGKAKMSAA